MEGASLERFCIVNWSSVSQRPTSDKAHLLEPSVLVWLWMCSAYPQFQLSKNMPITNSNNLPSPEAPRIPARRNCTVSTLQQMTELHSRCCVPGCARLCQAVGWVISSLAMSSLQGSDVQLCSANCSGEFFPCPSCRGPTRGDGSQPRLTHMPLLMDFL